MPAQREDYDLSTTWSDTEECWLCTCKEFPYITTIGSTKEDAETEMLDVIPIFLVDWGNLQ